MVAIPVWVSSETVPIRLLCELSSDEVAYAGSKGAHLGQLTRTGLPVPPGFVIGAPAYEAFRVQTGLAGRLQTLLSGLDVEDAAAVQQAAEDACRAVQESDLPRWLEDAITSAHRWVVGGEADAAVAVRSSGAAEDHASAWFAGVNQTFLDVKGVGAVVNRVKRSWMSLFSAETIRYRAERGLSTSDMDIAVIVQRQIPATRAGVIFTTDPAMDARDQLVIEAYLEYGSALATPDPGERRRDRYVVDKRLMSAVSREAGHRPILTDDEVFRLAELGVAIDREYGSPQDIEWVFDQDGLIWLLQSRPLFPEVAHL
jgi:pyruvate, water dikinase